MDDYLETYNQTFVKTFGLTPEKLNDELSSETLSEWDSVGQMELVTNLESAFGVLLEVDDIIDLNSYAKGKEILAKYDITL